MIGNTEAGSPARTDEEAPHAQNTSDAFRATAADLTKFQLRALAVIAEKVRYGLAIRRELSNYYGEEINHGRVYPNLDDLADLGLVEKRNRDDRSNEYELTERGHSVLAYEVRWLRNRQPDAENTPTGSYLPAETEGQQ